ncbi:hypothetical protein [Tianweitania sp.]|uniref:hypothetical protein n=1 Tax=Tianweitania sp. TaxID=2021634 RepID=UPI00289D2835|nr:hypothetical protein [Tianweitania sp.]
MALYSTLMLNSGTIRTFVEAGTVHYLASHINDVLSIRLNQESARYANLNLNLN